MDDVDAHIMKLNMLAAELEAEVERGTTLWNRTAHGGAPLTSEQINGVRAALKRLRKVVA